MQQPLQLWGERPLRRTAVTAAIGLGTALLLLVGTVTPASARIEDFASYDPQVGCARVLPPGSAFLAKWLVRRGGSIASTLRPCDSGGSSEHKDGRAVDWSADVADPHDVARVKALLADLFATDSHGNQDALARRLGVMYAIWNDHIYSAYNGFAARDYLNGGCSRVSSCSKTLRHRDHIHISLSRAGAAAQTSFYRSRHVANVPVVYPGTHRLNPVDTAIARVDVPSDGSTVRTSFSVVDGTTYRFVAEGRYRYGAASRVADAACSWSVRTGGWVRSDKGLLVNGRSPWAVNGAVDGAADGTEDCGDAGSATRQATWTAHRTGRLRLSLGDDTPRDNEGSLRFYVLRDDLAARSVSVPAAAESHAPRPARSAGPGARALVKETVALNTARARGPRTDRGLRRGQNYRIVVTGTARSGGTSFDGNCVRYAGRLRPQHSLDLANPAADHLTVAIQGITLHLRVPGSAAACSREHRYLGNYRAIVRGRARISLFDPYSYADNSGILTMTVTRRG